MEFWKNIRISTFAIASTPSEQTLSSKIDMVRWRQLLSRQMQNELPFVRMVAVLEQVESLPGAQCEPPIRDGNGERGGREC